MSLLYGLVLAFAPIVWEVFVDFYVVICVLSGFSIISTDYFTLVVSCFYVCVLIWLCSGVPFCHGLRYQ